MIKRDAYGSRWHIGGSRFLGYSFGHFYIPIPAPLMRRYGYGLNPALVLHMAYDRPVRLGVWMHWKMHGERRFVADRGPSWND